ncbi:MAG: tetratricopeptide repeat protein [Nitrospirae bacterium]|nr:tetratricopeptide repeat protein [Nitrospirota bacterium]
MSSLPGRYLSGLHLSESTVVTLVVLLALVVLSSIPYLQTLRFDFVNYDDDIYLFSNEMVVRGLTADTAIRAFTTLYTGNWHPLTWLIHLAGVSLFGLWAGGHHLINVLLHAANVALLFLLFRAMAVNVWRSAFIAALFALHPMNAESVAWVSESKGLLCTFFYLLAMWFYVPYSKKPSFNGYLPVFVSFAFALMAKPMAITLPFVLLLVDYWPLRRVNRKSETPELPVISVISGVSESPGVSYAPGAYRTGEPAEEPVSGGKGLVFLLMEKVPLAALSVADSIVTYYAQKAWNADSAFNVLPLKLRIANAFLSYAKYVGKAFYPSGMEFFYPMPGSFPAWKVISSVAAISIISSLALITARRRPYLFTGWFWFIATLTPVLGIVQVGTQAMADRYAYLPFIGLFTIISFAIPAFPPKKSAALTLKVSVAASVAILIILAMLSTKQAGYWKNSFELFSHATDVDEGNYVAFYNLGTASAMQGMNDDAIGYYEKAVAAKPDYTLPYLNMGSLFLNQKRLQEATHYFEKALEADHGEYRAYYGLASISMAMGREDDAIRYFEEVLKANPDFEPARRGLAEVKERLKRPEVPDK